MKERLTRPSGRHRSGYVSYVVREPSGSEKLSKYGFSLATSHKTPHVPMYNPMTLIVPMLREHDKQPRNPFQPEGSP